jgi:hypothetical protein
MFQQAFTPFFSFVPMTTPNTILSILCTKQASDACQVIHLVMQLSLLAVRESATAKEIAVRVRHDVTTINAPDRPTGPTPLIIRDVQRPTS